MVGISPEMAGQPRYTRRSKRIGSEPRMSTKPGLKVVKTANHNVGAGVDWKKVTRALLISRALDDLEEKTLLPGK